MAARRARAMAWLAESRQLGLLLPVPVRTVWRRVCRPLTTDH